MRTIKSLFWGFALITSMVIMPLGMATLFKSESEVTGQIRKVEFQSSDKRPFSWYYPYNYQYYYPRHQSDSCHWIYTNGAYVYTCS